MVKKFENIVLTFIIQTREKIRELKENKLHFEYLFHETVAQYKALTQGNKLKWPPLCQAKDKGTLAYNFDL